MRRGGVLGPTNSAYILVVTTIVIVITIVSSTFIVINIIVITIIVITITVNVIIINIAIIIILIILTRSHQFYQWINLTLIMQVLNISDTATSDTSIINHVKTISKGI